MTTLAAITDGTTTWFGADSLSQVNGIRSGTPVQKWTQLGDLWVGAAGLGRASIELQASELSYQNLDYLLTSKSEARKFGLEVCRDIRSLFKDQSWHLEPDGPGPELTGCSFCVVAAGWVWTTDGALTPFLVEPSRLCSHGSGWQIALGAGSVALSLGCTQESAVRLALEQAVAWDTGSGGEIYLYELTPSGVLETTIEPSAHERGT